MKISKYKSIIFDCDGVILNSNKIKTNGFRFVTENYGETISRELVKYHIKNGGISRYAKFDYFINEILKIKSVLEKEKLLMEFLNKYSEYTIKELLNSEIAYGLEVIREKTKGIKWHIVSGGDQKELNYIFKKKGIQNLFDGGIFGSPDNKDLIIKREKNNKNILTPSLYLGDSKLDYIVSNSNNLDFIFVSDWTEFKEYKSYFYRKSIKSINRIYDLIC